MKPIGPHTTLRELNEALNLIGKTLVEAYTKGAPNAKKGGWSTWINTQTDYLDSYVQVDGFDLSDYELEYDHFKEFFDLIKSLGGQATIDNLDVQKRKFTFLVFGAFTPNI